MGEQLSMFAAPADVPMETDHARGVYFWQATRAGGETVNFSSHPHPRLPHHCAVHRWYSSHPCGADHSPEAVAARMKLFDAPVKCGAGRAG